MKTMTMLTSGLLLVVLAGCSRKPDNWKTGDGAHHDHVHGKGPNGGVVFDLSKYHAEFTVDHKAKECTLLILGGDPMVPVAIDAAEFTVTTKETKTKEGKVVPVMVIKMLPRDAKDGKASKYVGTDPGLENVADFEGVVLGKIDGKGARGEFKEE